MPQEGYEMQWGKKGRDDLANIKAMGATAVRLYHSFGFLTTKDHSKFLDRAQEVGLNVMPGLHSDQEDIRTNLNVKKCGDDYDCYNYTKMSVLAGLQKQGYSKDGKWHPAISTTILTNEADFLDQFCDGGKSRWCSNKVILSAFEGLLAAEKEAGVEGTISVTACMHLD